MSFFRRLLSRKAIRKRKQRNRQHRRREFVNEIARQLNHEPLEERRLLTVDFAAGATANINESGVLNTLDFVLVREHLIDPSRRITPAATFQRTVRTPQVVATAIAYSGALSPSSISIVRMLRLVRLFRGLKSFTMVAVILDGLFTGLQSVGAILIILAVIMYMFAVAGGK